MRHGLRRHLSYANVMATAAVFIALGGSSYAAFTITGREIKDRSLAQRELKRNTLGGSRIKESRLGKVRRARNADRLNGLTAARLYGIADVTCESTDRRVALGRRLPGHDELMTALGDFGIALAAGGELTRNVYPSGAPQDGQVNVLYVTDAAGSVRSDQEARAC